MAMFIAPALAVIAYFAVDHVVSEVPHAAVQGSSYKLAAKSNCRYKSGTCTLENGDIEIKLRAEYLGDDYLKIMMTSAVPVKSALISFVSQADEDGREITPVEPVPMVASSDRGLEWTVNVDRFSVDRGILRLALNIADVLYYAETTTVFFAYETSFSRDNFSD
jgi:hypothetical protein